MNYCNAPISDGFCSVFIDYKKTRTLTFSIHLEQLFSILKINMENKKQHQLQLIGRKNKPRQLNKP